jgi:hypothetical protein
VLLVDVLGGLGLHHVKILSQRREEGRKGLVADRRVHGCKQAKQKKEKVSTQVDTMPLRKHFWYFIIVCKAS